MVLVRVIGVVAINIEQTVVRIAVEVTTCIQTRVRRVEVPLVGASIIPTIFQYNFTRGRASPSYSLLGEFLEAATEVPDREIGAVATNIEQTAVRKADEVTTRIQTRVRREEVPPVRHIRAFTCDASSCSG